MNQTPQPVYPPLSSIVDKEVDSTLNISYLEIVNICQNEISLRQKASDYKLEEKDLYERLAFAFTERYDHLDSALGPDWSKLYHGPIFHSVNSDGSGNIIPNIKLIDDSCLDYWKARSEQTKNYLLRSIYLNLYIDFYYRNNNKFPYKEVLGYLRALEVIFSDPYYLQVDGYKKLERGFTLAIALNKTDYIRTLIFKTLGFEKRMLAKLEPDKAGMATKLASMLLENSKICEVITSDQVEEILYIYRSYALADNNIGNTSGIFVVGHNSTALLNYYKSIKDDQSIVKVLNNWFLFCKKQTYKVLPIMSKTIALRDLNTVLNKYLYITELKILRKELTYLLTITSEDIHSEFGSFSVSKTIETDRINGWIEWIFSVEEEIIPKMLHEFVPLRTQLIELIEEQGSRSMLTRLAQRFVVDQHGMVTHQLRSVEFNLEDTLFETLTSILEIHIPFLEMALDQLKIRFEPKQLLADLTKNDMLDKAQIDDLYKTLFYFYQSDYLAFNHIAPSLIEMIIRRIIVHKGGSIYRDEKNQYGGYDVRLLNSLLEDSILHDHIGDSGLLYLTGTLNNVRGINIRNKTAHALNDKLYSNPSYSYFLFICLFILLYTK